MDFNGFELRINFHEKAIAALPDAIINGRNLREGYIRAAGIQFGNFQELFSADLNLVEAYNIALETTTALDTTRLANLYLLIRYYLPKIPAGHIAEFGVHKGGSALYMARLARSYLPHAKIYCFDSFEGMPDSSGNDLHQRGDFNDSEKYILEAARSAGLTNIILRKGFFADTVASEAPKIDGIALAHFDGDLYQSVVDCYDGTRGCMVPGGYMVFDDALQSSCLGAFDAVAERVIMRDRILPEQVYPHVVFREAI